MTTPEIDRVIEFGKLNGFFVDAKLVPEKFSIQVYREPNGAEVSAMNRIYFHFGPPDSVAKALAEAMKSMNEWRV